MVGKVLPLPPSQSRLPWAVETLRFCNWCDQPAQKDLNDCPTCGRRMSALPRSRRSERYGRPAPRSDHGRRSSRARRRRLRRQRRRRPAGPGRRRPRWPSPSPLGARRRGVGDTRQPTLEPRDSSSSDSSTSSDGSSSTDSTTSASTGTAARGDSGSGGSTAPSTGTARRAPPHRPRVRTRSSSRTSAPRIPAPADSSSLPA